MWPFVPLLCVYESLLKIPKCAYCGLHPKREYYVVIFISIGTYKYREILHFVNLHQHFYFLAALPPNAIASSFNV